MFVKHISRGNTALDEIVFIIWYMMHVVDLCYDENMVFMSWMYRSNKLTSFYVPVRNFAAQKYFVMENTIELFVNINGLWCSGVRTAWRNIKELHFAIECSYVCCLVSRTSKSYLFRSINRLVLWIIINRVHQSRDLRLNGFVSDKLRP